MTQPSPGRVLIVDDEAPLMAALRDALAEQGFETAGFTAPGSALEAVVPGRFDVLLTDLMMPAMDGVALLKAALGRDPDLVGIVMTGQGTIGSAVAAMQAGALDYILKPFKLNVAIPALSRALDIRRLRLRNAELERSVRQRTAELEAANRELEAFSYSVSHDLRAPLRAVSGFASILAEEHGAALAPEAARLLDGVQRGAHQMDRLIEDLLRFSRLGRQALATSRVDMAALALEVAGELRASVQPRVVEVRISQLPPAEADAGLVRQVWVNLLGNAFKFTARRARAEIEVGSAEAGGEVRYFVRDNGAGFDMAAAERLFGVFQRLHRSEEFDGTGIGLSLVQRVVQRHGGRVWAEGEVGRGATFTFTLAPPRA